MNVIVMGGLGQIGKALANILDDHNHSVYIIDKKDDILEPPERLKYGFLHVCIPHSENFLTAVRNAVRKYEPEFVVVHSTVPVGTTRRIGYFAAHSPVRGQHPHLEEGVQKFVKYVGAHHPKTREAVVAHLRGLRLTVRAWDKPEDTELAKLLCLSRYLNDLAFYETAFKSCQKFKVAPVRMLEWTWTYNDGYAGTKYVRPELTFPMGKVGGHCVIPVSKMLSNQTQYRFFRKNLDVFVGNRSPRKT